MTNLKTAVKHLMAYAQKNKKYDKDAMILLKQVEVQVNQIKENMK